MEEHFPHPKPPMHSKDIGMDHWEEGFRICDLQLFKRVMAGLWAELEPTTHVPLHPTRGALSQYPQIQSSEHRVPKATDNAVVGNGSLNPVSVQTLISRHLNSHLTRPWPAPGRAAGCKQCPPAY